MLAELSVYRASVDTPARVGWPADDAFRTYVCNLCLGGELDMDKKPSQISDEAREDMLVRFPALTNADPKCELFPSLAPLRPSRRCSPPFADSRRSLQGLSASRSWRTWP